MLSDDLSYHPSLSNGSVDFNASSYTDLSQWERANTCFATAMDCCYNCCPQLATWLCSGEVPGVDELVDVINSRITLAGKVSMFYTGLNRVRSSAGAGLDWLRNHPQETDSCDIVYYRTLEEIPAIDAYGNAINKKYKDKPTRAGIYHQRYQKLLSQAFAATAAGRVYVFMPASVASDGAGESDENTWRNWEYPALTRNPLVNRITRVDPTTDVPAQDIWVKGVNGPSQMEPRGTNWPYGLSDQRLIDTNARDVV